MAQQLHGLGRQRRPAVALHLRAAGRTGAAVHRALLADRDLRPIDKVPRLVQAELRHQLDWLRRFEQRLVKLADRLDAAPGHFALADTHMLLHYQPIPQIPWPRLLGKPEVRIALPLRVVQED